MALAIFGSNLNPLGLPTNGKNKQIPENPKFTKEENNTFFTNIVFSKC